jgi:hypothetical protein
MLKTPEFQGTVHNVATVETNMQDTKKDVENCDMTV